MTSQMWMTQLLQTKALLVFQPLCERRGSKISLAENCCVACVFPQGQGPWGHGGDRPGRPALLTAALVPCRSGSRAAASSSLGTLPQPQAPAAGPPTLTFSSPWLTLKTSSTTQPTARRAAPTVHLVPYGITVHLWRECACGIEPTAPRSPLPPPCRVPCALPLKLEGSRLSLT